MSDDLGHDERFQSIRRQLHESGYFHPSEPIYDLLDKLEREHIVWEKHGLAEIVKERDAARQCIKELEDAGRDSLRVLARISAMNSDYTACDFAIEKLRRVGIELGGDERAAETQHQGNRQGLE